MINKNKENICSYSMNTNKPLSKISTINYNSYFTKIEINKSSNIAIVILCSREITKILKLQPSKIIGNDLIKLVPKILDEDQVNSYLNNWKLFFKNGKSFSQELHVNINFKKQYFYEQISNIYEENGKYYCDRIVSDITSLKTIERNFLITENLPGVVYRASLNINGSLNLIYISNGIKSLIGKNPEDLINTDFYFQKEKFIIGANKEKLLSARKKLINNGTPIIDIEFQIKHQNGNIKHVYEKANKVKINNQYFIEGIIIDFTKQKNTEIELSKLNQELLLSNQLLEHFTHSFSHDLKEPVVSTGHFIDLLTENIGHDLSKKNKELLVIIKNSNKKIYNQINNILNCLKPYSK